MPSQSLVGREAELHALQRALEGPVLFTVMGSPGAGKTGLVRAFASADPRPTVWLEALDGSLPPPDPRLPAGALVVLDDVTGRIEGLAEWVAVAHRSGLPVVATSRDVLGLPGEQVLALAPLSTHGPEGSPAVQLFESLVGRPLEPEEREAGCALVRHAGGLPEAIEVLASAAGRVGPTVVLAEVDRRMEALERTGARVVRPVRLRLAREAADALLLARVE